MGLMGERMSEYKELIVHIATVMALEDECGQKELADMLEKAADAIDQLSTKCRQLEKERDAAIADIPTACGYCKWFRDFGEKVGCFCQKPCTNISGVNTMWEWRGVQEEENGTEI